MSILNQGAAAVSRSRQISQRKHDIGNGPGGVGDAAAQAALSVLQLRFAQSGLGEQRRTAGCKDGKECQVGIVGHVGHSAGEASHAQVVRACGVKYVRRSYARISASPGNDGTDHSAGAARYELVTGLDHCKLIQSESNLGFLAPLSVPIRACQFLPGKRYLSAYSQPYSR